MADSLYAYAPFYRMLHDERSEDLPFYLEATEGRGTVLEYGVGSGRVALPLARRGQQVTGVDNSASMLASLAGDLEREPPEVRARIRTIEADARTLCLGERFDAVTCPFNGLAHHHDAEQLASLFARVREHLRPEGVFVFDVAVPSLGLLEGTSTEYPWFRDPVDGAVCRATERAQYDTLTQVLTLTTQKRTMEDDREPVEMVLHLRQFFPQEMLLLLRHHGFEVSERRVELGDVIGYVCRVDRGRG